MIVLGKDKVDESFNILADGTIVNLKREKQKIHVHHDRPVFHNVMVHQIQMWTNYGWRDGRKWVIHHKDENKLNNSLSNLIFMTRSEHSFLHFNEKSQLQKNNFYFYWKGKDSPIKGMKFSEEVRKNMSLAHIGKKPSNKGKIQFTNGKINIYLKTNELPPKGFYKGMTRKK